MTDLEELERLALRATPGPWHSPGLGEVHDDQNNRVILDVCWPEEGVDISDSFSGGKQEDADFVACANPITILALTAEVRRLRADAARYQWAISREDRAEELYGAVLSNCPDSAAIDAEIDLVRTKEPT